MKNTVLVFPDITSLTNYLFQYKLPEADVKTQECSITASLSDDMIVIACTRFGAHVKEFPV